MIQWKEHQNIQIPQSWNLSPFNQIPDPCFLVEAKNKFAKKRTDLQNYKAIISEVLREIQPRDSIGNPEAKLLRACYENFNK
jgi:hypothetical protein